MPNPQALAFLSTYPTHSLAVGLCKAVALSTLTPLARAWTATLDLAHALPANQPEALSKALVEALPYLPPHTVVVCLSSQPLLNETEAPAPVFSPVLLYRPSYEQVFIAASAAQLKALPLAFGQEVWQIFSCTNTALRWHQASVHSNEANSSYNEAQDLRLLIPAACYLLNHWSQGGESLAFLKQAGAELQMQG
jgi:hypothetical protein